MLPSERALEWVKLTLRILLRRFSFSSFNCSELLEVSFGSFSEFNFSFDLFKFNVFGGNTGLFSIDVGLDRGSLLELTSLNLFSKVPWVGG